MSRRRLLGAVFAAPAVMALPVVAASSPDAALLADCARWLELHAIIHAPDNPLRHLDCDELPEWEEWMAAQEKIEAATPATLDGMRAMARVALVNAGGSSVEFDDNTALRVSLRLLLALAGEA